MFNHRYRVGTRAGMGRSPLKHHESPSAKLIAQLSVALPGIWRENGLNDGYHVLPLESRVTVSEQKILVQIRVGRFTFSDGPYFMLEVLQAEQQALLIAAFAINPETQQIKFVGSSSMETLDSVLEFASPFGNLLQWESNNRENYSCIEVYEQGHVESFSWSAPQSLPKAPDSRIDVLELAIAELQTYKGVSSDTAKKALADKLIATLQTALDSVKTIETENAIRLEFNLTPAEAKLIRARLGDCVKTIIKMLKTDATGFQITGNLIDTCERQSSLLVRLGKGWS